MYAFFAFSVVFQYKSTNKSLKRSFTWKLYLFLTLYFMVSPAKVKEKTTTKITAKTIVMLVITLLAGGGTMVE